MLKLPDNPRSILYWPSQLFRSPSFNSLARVTRQGCPNLTPTASACPCCSPRSSRRLSDRAMRKLRNPVSEPQSEAELNVPWRTYRVRNGSHSRLADRRARQIELRVVEYVEQLGAKL